MKAGTVVTKRQIDEFLSDPDYQALIDSEREHRLLFITDMTETRVSAFLAWLFRPHEGHGLGDKAIRALLLQAWRTAELHEANGNTKAPEIPRPATLATMSFADLLVETEYSLQTSKGQNSGRVDILLVSKANKLVVAIENKFGSRLGDGQLSAYRKAITRIFDGCKCVFVYLDINEANSPDDEKWVGMDYRWIVNLLHAQVEAGSLNARAIETLRQVKGYIDTETSTVTSSDLQRDHWIAEISAKHAHILAVFRSYRREGWDGRLRDMNPTIEDPLVIEYHQRWSFWNSVLDEARHVVVASLLRKEFGDEVEVSIGTSEVFARFRTWNKLQVDAENFWGPRVSAWCSRKATRMLYEVWAGVRFDNIASEKSLALRRIVESLRDKNLKRASNNATWVRISHADKKNEQETANLMIRELKRMNAEITPLLASTQLP